jgi:hypothetical protein
VLDDWKFGKGLINVPIWDIAELSSKLGVCLHEGDCKKPL